MWGYGVKGLAIGITIGYALSLAVAFLIWKRKRASVSLAITPEMEMNVAGTIDTFKEMQ